MIGVAVAHTPASPSACSCVGSRIIIVIASAVFSSFPFSFPSPAAQRWRGLLMPPPSFPVYRSSDSSTFTHALNKTQALNSRYTTQQSHAQHALGVAKESSTSR